MEQLYDYRRRLLDKLEGIVPEIADAVAAIPESRWHKSIAPGQRSPHAVAAHLRDVERHAYLVRLRKVLDEESPVLESFDPEGWEAQHYDAAEAMTAVLAEYARLREDELGLLRALPPHSWTRVGRHSAFGVRTVQWWAERMLQHATEHLDELRANGR